MGNSNKKTLSKDIFLNEATYQSILFSLCYISELCKKLLFYTSFSQFTLFNTLTEWDSGYTIYTLGANILELFTINVNTFVPDNMLIKLYVCLIIITVSFSIRIYLKNNIQNGLL